MRATWVMLRKELAVDFVSPLAYAFLGAFYLLAGLFFYLGLAMTGEPSLRVMLGNLALSLIFILPMLTMRHFAAEQRNGTLELLLTAPVSPGSLLLGKWLSSMVLCLMMLGGTLLFPLILEWYSDPDWRVIASSYLGLLCCCGAFCAVGLFASALTADMVAAGVLGVLFLLPFWLAGTAAPLVGGELGALLEQWSVTQHLRSFTRGVLDTGDLAWFLGVTSAFLFLTYRSLETRRWR